MRCDILVKSLVKDVLKGLASPGGVGKDSEKLERLGTGGGTIKWHSHYGNQYDSSSKNKNQMTMIQKAHFGVNTQKN